MSQSATIQFQKRKTTEFIAVLDIEQSSARDLDVAHRRLGYLCIGVHYVVTSDGTVQYGRDRDAVGAKLTTNHGTTLYIATTKPHTIAQAEALTKLNQQLLATYPGAVIYDAEDKRPC